MAIIAVVIFTVVSLAFTGLPGLPGLSGPSRPWIPHYAFTPPERRSILVSPDGESHTTADRTHPTKRDRSKKYILTPPRYEDQTPAPVVEVAPEPIEPVAPQTATISMGRRVKEAVATDPELSQFTRLTIGVRSMQGRVVLSGYVMDENEKTRIHSIAENIAGSANVDDRLKTLNS